ncbi:hypothetical protein [Eubacterium sp.]|uniref:hypothetical protein n=1 Tax=Eubacterium sp. TaxID=142586 RepID=UPI002582E79B|nr:hypothetical protein [Eubacterium sp.]
MDKLLFRPLTPAEIICRAEIQNNEVSVLMYKDARVDQNILDETVGPFNWQRVHSRDNANCTVSLWDADKNQWISKEDTGCESNADKSKGLASDSFKRACFNWGIGRELYTAPKVFIPEDYVHTERGRIFDKFSVMDLDVEVNENGIKQIKLITIQVTYEGKTEWIWSWKEGAGEPRLRKPSWIGTPAAIQDVATPVSRSNKPIEEKPSNTLTDDTVLVLGQFKGKTFGEVKSTKKFLSFVDWIKKNDVKYTSDEENRQYNLLKSM